MVSKKIVEAVGELRHLRSEFKEENFSEKFIDNLYSILEGILPDGALRPHVPEDPSQFNTVFSDITLTNDLLGAVHEFVISASVYARDQALMMEKARKLEYVHMLAKPDDYPDIKAAKSADLKKATAEFLLSNKMEQIQKWEEKKLRMERLLAVVDIRQTSVSNLERLMRKHWDIFMGQSGGNGYAGSRPSEPGKLTADDEYALVSETEANSILDPEEENDYEDNEAMGADQKQAAENDGEAEAASSEGNAEKDAEEGLTSKAPAKGGDLDVEELLQEKPQTVIKSNPEKVSSKQEEVRPLSTTKTKKPEPKPKPKDIQSEDAFDIDDLLEGVD